LIFPYFSSVQVTLNEFGNGGAVKFGFEKLGGERQV
jgi:hypothetical protein